MTIMDEWNQISRMNQAMKEDVDAYEFYKLARKYAHHDPFKCEHRNCSTCEALGIIENTQAQIAAAEYEKNWDFAVGQDIPF